MYTGTDTITLYDELAYEDELPVLWVPAVEQADPPSPSRFDEANLRLLHACAAMDDQPAVPREKLDDGSPLGLELARLDLKLTLLLDLVVHLASRDLRRPDPVPVRFNAIGATVTSGKLHAEVGAAGVMHIFLRNALPQPLSLPARIAAADDRQVKLRFMPVAEPIADLIEKLAFRRHRRHVAGARKPRP
jgi:hypothetical protein